MLEFTSANKRVVSMQHQVLSFVVAYAPVPSGDPKDLLGDFSAHLSDNGETWKGVIERNGPPD